MIFTSKHKEKYEVLCQTIEALEHLIQEELNTKFHELEENDWQIVSLTLDVNWMEEAIFNRTPATDEAVKPMATVEFFVAPRITLIEMEGNCLNTRDKVLEFSKWVATLNDQDYFVFDVYTDQLLTGLRGLIQTFHKLDVEDSKTMFSNMAEA